MPTVLLTPRARADIEAAVVALGLPADTWSRVGRSLGILEDFPLAGRALEGRWSETRFILGPWPWMVLIYMYRPDEENVYVVAVHDARSSSAARS